MDFLLGILAGFGAFLFRLLVMISGFIVFVYLALNITRAVRGPRPRGVLRHGNIVGVMCLLALTFVGLAFSASVLNVPGWERHGPRAVVFYLLVAMLSVTALYFAKMALWKVDFSTDKIVEHRTFFRSRSVGWREVLSWSLDDKSFSLILHLRNGSTFDIFFSDVDGAQSLHEALSTRAIPRKEIQSG